MSNSNLTVESLRAMWENLKEHTPPREPELYGFNELRGIGRDRFGGLKVLEAPPPPPKIQLRDIKFDDGTSILTPEFRSEMQSWLTGRFGFQKDLFKDNCYILGGHSIIASRNHIAMIRNSVA